MTVTVNAAAKINLLLDILTRLNNGYHSLFMIMQSVSLYDTVSIAQTGTGSIELRCSEPAIPCGEGNIAFKAAQLFFNDTGIKNGGIEISLEKRIPHEAGLAGGSADAAAVLYALDLLYETRLGERELRQMAVKLGADVPFCLTGGTALAQNIGEVLSPLPPLGDVTFVLAKPQCGVSTKQAYALFDCCESVKHTDRTGLLAAAAAGDGNSLLCGAMNVFEQFIEVPERVKIKSVMRSCECICCCMSGSGPTVFGAFSNEEQAQQCADKLREFIKDVYICKPVEQAIVLADKC